MFCIIRTAARNDWSSIYFSLKLLKAPSRILAMDNGSCRSKLFLHLLPRKKPWFSLLQPGISWVCRVTTHIVPLHCTVYRLSTICWISGKNTFLRAFLLFLLTYSSGVPFWGSKLCPMHRGSAWSAHVRSGPDQAAENLGPNEEGLHLHLCRQHKQTFYHLHSCFFLKMAYVLIGQNKFLLRDLFVGVACLVLKIYLFSKLHVLLICIFSLSEVCLAHLKWATLSICWFYITGCS